MRASEQPASGSGLQPLYLYLNECVLKILVQPDTQPEKINVKIISMCRRLPDRKSESCVLRVVGTRLVTSTKQTANAIASLLLKKLDK